MLRNFARCGSRGHGERGDSWRRAGPASWRCPELRRLMEKRSSSVKAVGDPALGSSGKQRASRRSSSLPSPAEGKRQAGKPTNAGPKHADTEDEGGGSTESGSGSNQSLSRSSSLSVIGGVPRHGTFICAGGEGIVEKILLNWGWRAEPDTTSKTFDLKWSTKIKNVDRLVLPESQLVNHFRGTNVLNHKAKMGRFLARCPTSADRFFPRQYSVYQARDLRRFMFDYIVTQAAALAKQGAAEDATAKIARTVLKRAEAAPGGDAQPLLHCAHEFQALLGAGHHVPVKAEALLKRHVTDFLEAAAADPAASCACCTAGEGQASAQAAPAAAGERASAGEGSAPAGEASTPASCWPRQECLSGPAQAWVVKDPSLSRGRSITVLSGLRSILSQCERCKSSGLDWNCVVQKYIENPLLVPRTDGDDADLASADPGGPPENPPDSPSDAPSEAARFAKTDGRCWVLVLDWNPLVVFAHPEVYFRVAIRPYEFHGVGQAETFAHATNCRDKENRVTLAGLMDRLGPEAACRWEKECWPQLLDAVRASLFAVRDGVVGTEMDHIKHLKTGAPRGPSAFELFGFDFAVDSDMRPWVLEANTSPDMLRTCEIPEIVEWADMATEAMLRLAFSYHARKLRIPKPSELEQRHCEEPIGARVFQPGFTCGGHCEPGTCFGEAVAKVPRCLVKGYDIGEASAGGWLLILRERVVDESMLWKSYTACELTLAGDPNETRHLHSRVLRDWLLPVPVPPREEAAQAAADASPARQRPRPLAVTQTSTLAGSPAFALRASRSQSSLSLRSHGNADAVNSPLRVRRGAARSKTQANWND